MKPDTAVGKLDANGKQRTSEACGCHGIVMHRKYHMQANFSSTIKTCILNNLANLKQNRFYI
jgi:hypothetical protein